MLLLNIRKSSHCKIDQYTEINAYIYGENLFLTNYIINQVIKNEQLHVPHRQLPLEVFLFLQNEVPLYALVKSRLLEIKPLSEAILWKNQLLIIYR